MRPRDDNDSFESFVAGRSTALVRTAYLLTGDRSSAEDLVQSALVKVAPRWDRICAAGPPEAYVRTVMYREHVSAWRRRGTAEQWQLVASISGDVAPDPSAEITLRLTVAVALDRLTRKQRAVIVLRYFDDLSETAVADLLGCSVGNVRSQTARALERLRTLVPAMLEEVPSQ